MYPLTLRDPVRGRPLRAVLEERGRIRQHTTDVDFGVRLPLRFRIREKAADRLVQAVRLAEHDIHQLRLIGCERQLLAQDLDRSRHRRQRIADLVRDAGRHLSHRR